MNRRFYLRAVTGFVVAFVVLLGLTLAVDALNLPGPAWVWSAEFAALSGVLAALTVLWAGRAITPACENRAECGATRQELDTWIFFVAGRKSKLRLLLQLDLAAREWRDAFSPETPPDLQRRQQALDALAAVVDALREADAEEGAGTV